MKKLLVLLCLSGCVSPPPPTVTSACTWDRIIHPNAGFETRWTSDEVRQVLTHNRQLEAQCPSTTN